MRSIAAACVLLIASSASAQPELLPSDASRERAPQLDEPGDVVARVALELLGGAVGYALGAGAGGLIGCGIGAGIDEDTGCPIGAVVGGIVGAGFGIAGGVTLTGGALGANGGFWPAYAGQFLGGLVSLLFLPLLDEHPEALFIAAIGFPLIGGVRGYERSGYRRRAAQGPGAL